MPEVRHALIVLSMNSPYSHGYTVERASDDTRRRRL